MKTDVIKQDIQLHNDRTSNLVQKSFQIFNLQILQYESQELVGT